ncbi:hypothetical protein A2532_01235 [Candidatus Wolfebacteria bacterium RIFOXYD2_FULL_48_11]|nr:MAG: hypothetical protein A2532_01235 [Candidatus Wolfebacteria bacterium RIFOXYD2_FULL_48_11]
MVLFVIKPYASRGSDAWLVVSGEQKTASSAIAMAIYVFKFLILLLPYSVCNVLFSKQKRLLGSYFCIKTNIAEG